MKRAIELLDEALELLGLVFMAEGFKKRGEAEECVKEAICLLKMPRWETPEQYEKRTGKPWPDDWAVYCRRPKTRYGVFAPELGYIQWTSDLWGKLRHAAHRKYWHIICATEAGPPPKKWEPEEVK